MAVIKSSCKGLINAGILSQTGASTVYYSRIVANNTRRVMPLSNSSSLHKALVSSKHRSPALNLGVDYVIVEAGVTGLTFPWKDMTSRFDVICITAATGKHNHEFKVVRQQVVDSTHANRKGNMLFLLSGLLR